MSDFVDELVRLNERYESVKTDPNWTEEMLNILITAQFDLAKMCVDEIPTDD